MDRIAFTSVKSLSVSLSPNPSSPGVLLSASVVGAAAGGAEGAAVVLLLLLPKENLGVVPVVVVEKEKGTVAAAAGEAVADVKLGNKGFDVVDGVGGVVASWMGAFLG